jgi:hypothetical protein
MRWGFPRPPKLGNRPVTTIRSLSSSYWRSWLTLAWRQAGRAGGADMEGGR